MAYRRPQVQLGKSVHNVMTAIKSVLLRRKINVTIQVVLCHLRDWFVHFDVAVFLLHSIPEAIAMPMRSYSFMPLVSFLPHIYGVETLAFFLSCNPTSCPGSLNLLPTFKNIT